jgi:glycerol uptake facilitator-like aquaporin
VAHLWVYLTAPVLGAAIAVGCWRLVHAPPVPEPVLEEVAV